MNKILYRFWKTAIEHYGFDLVDRQGNDIIIRYPKVTISNTKGNEHTIKELFIRFSVEPHIGRLQGTRLCVTPEEERVSYLHSHLVSFKLSDMRDNQYKNFCMGSAVLRDYVLDINNLINCSSQIEQIIIYGFYELIDKYVAHESLEGYPHIHFSKVYASNNLVSITISDRSIAIKNFENYLKNHPEDINKVPFFYQDEYGRSMLLINESFEKLLYKITPVKCIVNDEGEEVIQINNPSKAGKYQELDTYITFKNKNLKRYIYNNKRNEEVKNNADKVPSEIRREITRILENRYRELYIKNKYYNKPASKSRFGFIRTL